MGMKDSRKIFVKNQNIDFVEHNPTYTNEFQSQFKLRYTSLLREYNSLNHNEYELMYT